MKCRVANFPFSYDLYGQQTLFFHNCHPTVWLYSPARMRNNSQKKSHNFRRLQLSSIFCFNLIEFSKNRYEEFQLGPMLFNLVNCIHIVGSQTIAAIILGFQSFFWKTLPKDNRRSLRFLTYEHRKKHFKDPLKSRY